MPNIFPLIFFWKKVLHLTVFCNHYWAYLDKIKNWPKMLSDSVCGGFSIWTQKLESWLKTQKANENLQTIMVIIFWNFAVF